MLNQKVIKPASDLEIGDQLAYDAAMYQVTALGPFQTTIIVELTSLDDGTTKKYWNLSLSSKIVVYSFGLDPINIVDEN